jgi:hypothetical protein
MIGCNDLAPCSSFEKCDDCTASPRCGWCSSTPDRTDAVGCVPMTFEDAPTSLDENGQPKDTKQEPQWMPPQTEGWCPGNSYQHKYKCQCQEGQPTLKDAQRTGVLNQNILKSEQMVRDLTSLGDQAKQQLVLLLNNVHAAKSQLERNVKEARPSAASNETSLQTYYTSSNETSMLTMESKVALVAYQKNNKTYYDLLAAASTPGNVTGDDVQVQQKLERLSNATRDRSQARDEYNNLVKKRQESSKNTKTYRCIVKVKALILASTEERYNLLKQEEMDDARVAEVVNLHLVSNSSARDEKTVQTLSKNEALLEDARETVTTLETNYMVQQVQRASYQALEQQESKATESIVLYNEAQRQNTLDAKVKDYEMWANTNQTKLSSSRAALKTIETASAEAKHLQAMKDARNAIDIKLAELFQHQKQNEQEKEDQKVEENAETKQQLNSQNNAAVQALKAEHIEATQQVDTAQTELTKAMNAHKELIRQQEHKVSQVKTSLQAAQKAADVDHNRLVLNNALSVTRKKANERMLKQDTERQNLNDATHQKLNQARRTAREQEKHIYNLKKNSFAAIVQRVTQLVAGDKAVNEYETQVKEQSKLALETCQTNPSDGPFESLETSLTTFNDAVVQEHEKASEMLTKNNGDGEKEKKEKENGAKKEGAMFAKNVGRAEAIKGRNCNALNTLEEISSMLRRRLVEARSHEVELSNAPPAVSQSLQRAIANLEHHEQHVMEVEGEMRMKCADATSFARQTKQEAMVAAAMRMGNFTTNAMNGTNL